MACSIVIYLSANVQCKVNFVLFLGDLFISFYWLVKGDVCRISIPLLFN